VVGDVFGTDTIYIYLKPKTFGHARYVCSKTCAHSALKQNHGSYIFLPAHASSTLTLGPEVIYTVFKIQFLRLTKHFDFIKKSNLLIQFRKQ
jgi:hypothetical protein